jgi:hypothetical protein
MFYGTEPQIFEFKDGDPFNTKIENLEITTKAEISRKKSTSSVLNKGVRTIFCKNGSKVYLPKVTIQHKYHYFKTYKIEEDAVLLYKTAIKLITPNIPPRSFEKKPCEQQATKTEEIKSLRLTMSVEKEVEQKQQELIKAKQESQSMNKNAPKVENDVEFNESYHENYKDLCFSQKRIFDTFEAMKNFEGYISKKLPDEYKKRVSAANAAWVKEMLLLGSYAISYELTGENKENNNPW